MNKYVVFISIVLVAVFLDLWTKNIAENNLASVTSRWDHSLELDPEIDPDEVLTLQEFIDGRFGEGSLDSGEVRGVSIVDESGQSQPGMGLRVLNEGDTVRIGYRKVEIVSGFWNHVYVQNYGAAWGFLSGRDARFVRPFFLTVSIIAVIIVLGIFRGVRQDQKLLTVALSLIVGGALGNFVDRARYGYVVDFVDWYASWGGSEHHWPTFNVADVWITIGVAFMLIEIMLNKDEDESKPAKANTEADSASAAA
ncbi:MAG: lipoprotein signal peptidase [Bradymonadia bacterium]|jgi:lipoprotein signal peptidase